MEFILVHAEMNQGRVCAVVSWILSNKSSLKQ